MGSFPVPPFKIPNFLLVLRVITAKRVMINVNYEEKKSAHSCRFVHHAKFYCILTTLINVFKIEFERRGWKRASVCNVFNGEKT